MKYRSLLTFFVSLNLMFGSSYAALVQDLQADDEPELIQLYSQNELNMLISDNKHLERVLLDECQFTKDIEDRAMVLHYPSYLYLWADMNFTNTCVNGDPAVGVRALKLAAEKQCRQRYISWVSCTTMENMCKKILSWHIGMCITQHH